MYVRRHELLSKPADEVRSDGQKAALLEKRGTLLHKIERWRKLQAVYMPGVLDADATDAINTADPESSQRTKAESITLWLPSQLDEEDRVAICSRGVIDSEKQLRFAQLEDSLNALRRARRTRRGLIDFHKVQLAGQGQKTQTKSQAVMQTVQVRINKCVRRYRVARNALLCLDPDGGWKDLYRPLTNEDNRGPGKEPDEMLASDGKYIGSWIWASGTTAVSRDEVNEDMRVEWAQCVARADRWEEERTLLQEEMRRAVQFLEWRSTDWLAKVGSRAGTTTSVVRSGLSAYAKKQGAVFHNLAVRFCQCWREALISHSLPHDWATEFLETHKEPLSNLDFKKQPREARGPPAVHPHAESSASVPTPANAPPQPLPASTETINLRARADVLSDGNLSDDNGSRYDSDGSSE